jgi:hypothetical protein
MNTAMKRWFLPRPAIVRFGDVAIADPAEQGH